MATHDRLRLSATGTTFVRDDPVVGSSKASPLAFDTTTSSSRATIDGAHGKRSDEGGRGCIGVEGVAGGSECSALEGSTVEDSTCKSVAMVGGRAVADGGWGTAVATEVSVEKIAMKTAAARAGTVSDSSLLSTSSLPTQALAPGTGEGWERDEDGAKDDQGWRSEAELEDEGVYDMLVVSAF